MIKTLELSIKSMSDYNIHPRLQLGDCSSIYEKVGHRVTREEFIDALDIIISYFYMEKLSFTNVNISKRNKNLAPTKEMTISDIEELLGYKIKIVKENKND